MFTFDFKCTVDNVLYLALLESLACSDLELHAFLEMKSFTNGERKKEIEYKMAVQNIDLGSRVMMIH